MIKIKKKSKFLRRSVDRYSKLGLRKKKKQRWKRPTGRHNKMRAKRRGYPATVDIGYGNAKSERKEKIIIRNLEDLKKTHKDKIIVLGNIGKKKKLEIAKAAKEKNIEISNLNVKKFLKKIERKNKEKEKKEKKISAKEAKEIIKKKEEKADSKEIKSEETEKWTWARKKHWQ